MTGILASVFIVVDLGYEEATRDPIIRYAEIVDQSPAGGGSPVRIVLMSDTHVQGPDMSPARLARIVRLANTLHPDMFVLAGDFMGNSPVATKSYTVAEAVRPLEALRAPLGVVAVLGNNDRQVETTRKALAASHVTVLDNDAVQRGSVAIGGYRTRIGRTVRRLSRLRGTKILVAHSPDLFPQLPPTIALMLSGHTHCGQVVLPFLGAVSTGSRFGDRYRCGLIEESDKTLIVTAGLGTSQLPLRLGAPPDVWLITIHHEQPRRVRDLTRKCCQLPGEP